MNLNVGFNNPWWNLGIGLLSQPTMGQGLMAGTQMAQQAGAQDLQNQFLQQRMAENARRVQMASQIGSLMNPNNRPPALLQRPDLPQFVGNELMGLLGEYSPEMAPGLLQPPQEGMTDLAKKLVEAGLTPGTPEFQQAMMRAVLKPQTEFTNMINNIPSGYEPDPARPGGLRAIPGGPEDLSRKPPTDTQQTTALYTDRAYKASSILDSLEGKYNPYAINVKNMAEGVWGLGPTMLGPMANLKLSPEDQMAEQAQRDFVNAILRRESGSVINQDEFDNAKKQYFPQPGDSPEVIRQKRENRRTAYEALKRGSGQNYRYPDLPSSSVPPMPPGFRPK